MKRSLDRRLAGLPAATRGSKAGPGPPCSPRPGFRLPGSRQSSAAVGQMGERRRCPLPPCLRAPQAGVRGGTWEDPAFRRASAGARRYLQQPPFHWQLRTGPGLKLWGLGNCWAAWGQVRGFLRCPDGRLEPAGTAEWRSRGACPAARRAKPCFLCPSRHR